MTIDQIDNGIVLDHIKAGNAMAIYRYLKLDELDCTVAFVSVSLSAFSASAVAGAEFCCAAKS